MPKKKSISINEIVEAISLGRKAPTEWPAGFANRLIRELIQRGIGDFQELLVNSLIANKKKDQRGK